MSKVLKCPHCAYVTDRTYNYNRHIKKHDDSCDDATVCTSVSESNNVIMDQTNVIMKQENVIMDQKNGIIGESSINQCNKCKKTFTTTWYMKQHTAKCQGPTSPLVCQYCHRDFANRHNKSRHMKTCDGTSRDGAIVVPTNPSGNNLSLGCPVTQIAPTHHITNVQTVSRDLVQNQTNNVNIQINIQGYGRENVDHITDAFKEARLHEINGHGIYNMIKSIHFNPDYPENHNIRKHDSKYCKIYGDDEWMLRSMKTALEELVLRYKYQLKDYLVGEPYKQKMASDPNTWLELHTHLAAFDKDTKPADFYRTIRDVTTLMETMESMYAKKELASGSIST